MARIKTKSPKLPMSASVSMKTFAGKKGKGGKRKGGKKRGY